MVRSGQLTDSRHSPLDYSYENILLIVVYVSDFFIISENADLHCLLGRWGWGQGKGGYASKMG